MWLKEQTIEILFAYPSNLTVDVYYGTVFVSQTPKGMRKWLFYVDVNRCAWSVQMNGNQGAAYSSEVDIYLLGTILWEVNNCFPCYSGLVVLNL